MGGRQRAQERNKKNGSSKAPSTLGWSSHAPVSGPRFQGTTNSRANTRGLRNDWQDFSDSHALPQNAAMSMSQAARNTERHATAWGSSKLREQAILFVSAGELKQDEIEAVAEANEGNLPDLDQSHQQESQPQHDQQQPPSIPVVFSPPDPAPIENESPTADPVLTSSSSARLSLRRQSTSSQSDEEIIFAGRRTPLPKSAPHSTPPTSKPPSSPEPTIAKNQYTSQAPQDDSKTHDSSSSGLDKYENIFTAPPPDHPPDRRGRRRIRPGYNRNAQDDEAIMNDYIANMTFEDSEDDEVAEKSRSVKKGRRTEHFRFFDGATESKVKLQSSAPTPVTRRRDDVDQAIDWDSADMQDFDDFSTTNEEIVEVTQVLRHRIRPSGAQYLVSPLGLTEPDPRWVHHKKLTSASALEEIRIFEELQAVRLQETTGDSGDSEDDEAEEDLNDDLESEDDENNRIMRQVAHMTDEQIARTLAKQEELGLGGDEILLLDGMVDDFDEDNIDDDDDDDDFANGDGFIPFSAKKHMSSRTQSKRNKRRSDHFPNASALADAIDQDPYGAFDIMDFDRPSLKPKKKGRKSGDIAFDLGVEDPELAEQINSTWAKDRAKKAARKLDKQLAREEALLDASERNHPAAIKAEIRQFLCQEAVELKLAPMDANLRAAVHRLAKSLRLHSKSEGKDGHGIGRYPVLTKGPHTPYHTIDTIWEIDALMEQRKFFPKNLFDRRSGPRGRNNAPSFAAARARRGGGGMASGATYSNGDVVGAYAPEIGVENKGRAMLEKMGWTQGVGIGAVGNKGSVEVIKHVVKTTKAGLG